MMKNTDHQNKLICLFYLCAIILIQGIVVRGQSSNNKPAFGTQNGYDVGGDEPLCFESVFSKSADNASYLSNAMERLNQQLFEAQDAQVELLPSCYDGTSMKMTPLDLENEFDDNNPSSSLYEEQQQQLYTDRPYTFRLNAEVDLKEVLNGRNGTNLLQNFSEDGFVFIHCRLHLCDALEQGFCNPLTDTRERDNEMTSRTETDKINDKNEKQADEPLPQDESKWKYSEGTPLIGLANEDRNGNGESSTIYTRWIKWKLRESDVDNTIYRAKVDMSLYLPEETTRKGIYFFLGHLVVDFDLGNGIIQRLDIAQTIPNKIVQVRPPPKILTVTDTCKIWLGIVIGIVGIFALYCLIFIIIKRNHQVIKLAQGSFLASMAGACLIQTIFSFTYMPINDIYCQINGPLIHIPMTFVGAVLVGRIWRIYTTLNAANAMGRSNNRKQSWGVSAERLLVRSLDCLAGIFTCFNFCICSSQGGNLRSSSRASMRTSRASVRGFRRAVTAQETLGLITILTFPQIVLQILTIVLTEDGLVYEFTTDGNIGRIMCKNCNVEVIGMCISAVIFFLAVCMAWISRDLPSAFNEKDQIFNAATIGTILTVISVALGQITNQPTTSPDVYVFLRSCITIGVAASVLILIIWPKVSRVRSGDKVVVSSLLGARFSMSTSSSQSEAVTDANAIASEVEAEQAPQQQKRIKLNEDDAIPCHIERKIENLQCLLRTVTNHCNDGRSLTEKEWTQMHDEIAKLKLDLDLVDFNFNSRKSQATRNAETFKREKIGI